MERNFNYHRVSGTRTTEKNSGISQTIPDQTMSITEIMQRHSRGLAIDQKVPLYHSEEEQAQETGRDIRTMDISEVHAEMQEINQRIQERTRLAQEKKTQEQKDNYARLEQQKREQWRKEWEAETMSKNQNK